MPALLVNAAHNGLSAARRLRMGFLGGTPVLAAFRGLNVIVIAMIANAALNFGRSSIKNWRDAILSAGAAVFLIFHGSPIIAILATAALSLQLYHGVNLPAKPAHAAGPDGGRRMLRFAAVLALLVATGLVIPYLLDRRLFDLATLMLKVDVFAFGGGFASVPLLFNEVVTARQWLDGPTLSDGIVLGQVTPGPIVITATFVGYLLHGIVGAIVATVSVFLPSFLIVIAVAPHFDRLRSSPAFARLIGGALCSFPGLLLIVTAHFAQNANWDITRLLLTGIAFVTLRLGANIFWVVVGGTAFALTFCR